MGEAFEVFGEPAAAAEPGEGAFHDPAFGQHLEAFGGVRSLDDLDLERGCGFARARPEQRPGITAVGEQLFEEWPAPEQRGEQQDAAIAVLDIGGMNDGVKHEA